MKKKDPLSSLVTNIKKIAEDLEGFNCKNCYGKGYSTELNRCTWGTDFGHETPGEESRLNINLCDCSRGKDLDKYFEIRDNNINVLYSSQGKEANT